MRGDRLASTAWAAALVGALLATTLALSEPAWAGAGAAARARVDARRDGPPPAPGEAPVVAASGPARTYADHFVPSPSAPWPCATPVLASPCAPCTSCAAPCGNPPCAQADRWRFHVAFAVWLPGVYGDTFVAGKATEKAFDWTEWFDKLDDVEFVLQGAIGASYGRWWADLQASTMTVGNSVPIRAPGGPVLDLEELCTFVGLHAGYDLCRTPLRGGCSLTWGPYLGVRWYHVAVEGSLPPIVTVDESEQWFDPLVGGRARLTLSPRLAVIVDGNVGGFGLGSDFSWSLFASAELRLARWLALRGGWGIIDADYATGSGSDRFEFDLHLTGPFLALDFQF